MVMEVETISAGSGVDKITLGAGSSVDKITLNEGADVVVFDTITATANANNVVNFGSNDKLQFDATTFTSLVSGQAVSIVDVAGAQNTANNKEIVVDTAANIATLNQTTAVKRIAIATDTGNIIYDADGDFTSGSVIIGNIGTAAASLTADNFVVA